MRLNVKIIDNNGGDYTMKNLKYVGIVCLLATIFGSCDKNEMPIYETDYTALNIWFGSEKKVSDSLSYNYSYSMGEGSLTFFARVAGVSVDYDRTFILEAYDGDLSEAEGSYWTETYTIKAGETLIECPIHFDTSLLKDADSFTERDGYLFFRMAANEEFVSGTEERSVLKVVLKNYLGKPDEWDNAIGVRRKYSDYFGEYSKAKYQFMVSTLGIIDFHIEYGFTGTYDEESNTMSISYAKYLVQKLQVALEEYNNDPNNPNTPLRDETGSVVTF